MFPLSLFMDFTKRFSFLESWKLVASSNIKIGDPLNIEIEQTTFTTVETIKKVLIQKRLKTK